jgi:dolichyl-phosphate-mannose--protein O-mannosyl transferase
MLILGCFHAIAGFVGIFDEDYYQVGESGLVVTVDYTTWGWTHLLLGILVVLAGAALLRGATWARVVAILLAVVSAIANLAFMPAYPLWSLIMVILNVLVIYAVTAHGDRESLGAY